MMASRDLKVLVTGDASGLHRAFRQVTHDTKEVESSVTRMQAKIRSKFDQAGHDVQHVGRDLSKHALGIAAGFTSIAGAAAAVEDSVSAVEDLAKGTALLSRTTGFDTKTASEWVQVAKLRGVQAQQLNMGFVTLSKQMTAAAEGSTKSAAAFTKLGISQEAVKRGDINEILHRSADAFERLPAGANKAALAQQLFGRQSRTLLQLLNEGSKGLDENLHMVDQYGAALDKGGIEKAKQMIEQQHRMDLAFEGIKVTLGTALLPVIADGAKKLAEFIKGIRDGTGAGGKFADALDSIWQKAKPVVQFLKDHPKLIAIAIGAWAAYKVASLAALAAINVAKFRAVFFKSVPVAGAAGTAAGGAFAGGFAAEARSGKIRGAFRFAGQALGIVMAAQVADQIANAVGQATHSSSTSGSRAAHDIIHGQVPNAGRGNTPAQDIHQAVGGGGDLNPLGAIGHVIGGLFHSVSAGSSARAGGSAPPASLTGVRSAGGRGRGARGLASAGPSAQSSALAGRRYSHTELMRLWVAAGGSAAAADEAAAVAQAESGGYSGASNVNTNGSIDRGLWQINSVHGSLSTFDPMGNARAAVSIWRSAGGSFARDWVTVQKGMDVQYRTGGTVSGGASGGHGRGHGGGGGGGGSGHHHPAFDTGTGGISDGGTPAIGNPRHPISSPGITSSAGFGVPGTGLYDQGIASADFIDSGGSPAAIGLAKGTTGDSVRRAAIKHRIKVLKGRLKKRLTRATRTAIIAELASLRGELQDLNAPADTSTSGDTSSADGGGTGEDPNQPLIDALAAATDAQNRQADEVKGLKEQMAADLRFKTQLFGTQTGVVLAGIADMVSGQIGGRTGLGVQTPAFAGSRSRY